MNKSFFMWISCLVAILLIAGCAPEFKEQPAIPAVIDPSSAIPLAATSTAEIMVSEPTPSADVQPAATSRGPNLEATDPTEVSLASGQLQLVEFFRFT